MAFAIYGTGGFAREVAPLVSDSWLAVAAGLPDDDRMDIVHVDDNSGRHSACNGRTVIDFEALCSDEHRSRKIVIAIANGETRRKIEQRCEQAGLTIAHIQAASARVMDEVEIAPGAILCDNVVITSNIKIGRSFHANIFSYVAHDCIIGDYVTFAPRVNCNGNVHIGNHVYVGTGAMFIQGTSLEPLTIGDGAIIGMGAVVTKPVAPNTLVVGNPARARSIAIAENIA